MIWPYGTVAADQDSTVFMFRQRTQVHRMIGLLLVDVYQCISLHEFPLSQTWKQKGTALV